MSYASCLHICTASPTIKSSHQNAYICYTCEPALTHHYHSGPQLHTKYIHSWYIQWVCHMCPPLQYFTECFHCRENLKLCLFIPYFPLTLGNIDVCLLSCKSPRPFLEYHMVGIIQSMPFILASFISERVLKNKLQKSFTVEKKYRVVDGEYHSLSREIT